MTPINCHMTLEAMANGKTVTGITRNEQHKQEVVQTINNITNTTTPTLVGSSGLSMQYAIMMGLVDHAKEQHPNNPIYFIVPPNCYGGTNDQARRVAASITNVHVMDLSLIHISEPTRPY